MSRRYKYEDYLKDKRSLMARGYFTNYKFGQIKSSLVYIVDKYGYEYQTTYANLLKYNPSKFSKFNPYTIKNINLYLRLNGANEVFVSGEYINNTTKSLKLTFRDCGHFYYTNLVLLQMNLNKLYCRTCNEEKYTSTHPIGLENAKNLVKSFNCTPLFKEYKNGKTPLKFKTEDGYIVNMSYNNLSRGKGFRGGIFSKRNIDSIYNMNHWIKINNHPIELLSTENKGNKDMLLWRCLIHDNTFSRTWSGVYSVGRIGCGECFRESIRADRGLSYEEVIKVIKENNPRAKLLTEKYVNSQQYLQFECLDCGNTNWFHRIGNFKANSKCPVCGENLYKGNPDGYYVPYRADKNKEGWLKIPSMVYIIKCYNDTEIFYKIGITKHSNIRKRYPSKKSMPYMYEIVDKYDTNRYDAIYIEDYLHELNKENHYIPNIEFAGFYNECFTQYTLGKYKTQFQPYNENEN